MTRKVVVALYVIAMICGALVLRFDPYGIIALLALCAAPWLLVRGRRSHIANPSDNPMGIDRDYSTQPAAQAALHAFGYFAGAVLWSAAVGFSQRYRLLPDTDMVSVTVWLLPFLALTAIGTKYLLDAIFIWQFGRRH